MPEVPFDPSRHLPPRPGRGKHLLSAEQIARHNLHPPAIGEFLWHRTREVRTPSETALVVGRFADKWVYYQRNGLQFVRAYREPRDPRSPYQLDHRQRMTLVQREWRNVSDADRDEWGRAGQSVWPMRYRETLWQTGQNLFASAQMQRLSWGDGMRHAAPGAPCPAAPIEVEEVPVAAGLGFAFRVRHRVEQTTGCRLLVEMTPATKSPAHKPAERALTRAATTDAGSYFPLNDNSAVYLLDQLRYPIAPGQRFAIRLTILTDDGLRSHSLKLDLIRKDPAAPPGA